MREIKFRGINTSTNKFIYGSLIKLCSGWDCSYHIQDEIKQNPFQVIPETVGQFTEFNDWYKDDILDSPSGIKFKIVWYKGCWMYQNIHDKKPSGYLIEVFRCWKRVGNIHTATKKQLEGWGIK